MIVLSCLMLWLKNIGGSHWQQLQLQMQLYYLLHAKPGPRLVKAPVRWDQMVIQLLHGWGCVGMLRPDESMMEMVSGMLNHQHFALTKPSIRWMGFDFQSIESINANQISPQNRECLLLIAINRFAPTIVCVNFGNGQVKRVHRCSCIVQSCQCMSNGKNWLPLVKFWGNTCILYVFATRKISQCTMQTWCECRQGSFTPGSICMFDGKFWFRTWDAS